MIKNEAGELLCSDLWGYDLNDQFYLFCQSCSLTCPYALYPQRLGSEAIAALVDGGGLV